MVGAPAQRLVRLVFGVFDAANSKDVKDSALQVVAVGFIHTGSVMTVPHTRTGRTRQTQD